MTRLRLKFVQAWVDREGRVHRYFRRPGYPRVRLPGLPGSAEFNRAYEAALEGRRSPSVPRREARQRQLLCGRVLRIARVQRPCRRHEGEASRHPRTLPREHGDKPIALLPPKFIVPVLSQMKPHAARNWLKAIRALLQFAVAHEMSASDPTLGIKLPGSGATALHVDRR